MIHLIENKLFIQTTVLHSSQEQFLVPSTPTPSIFQPIIQLSGLSTFATINGIHSFMLSLPKGGNPTRAGYS